VARVAAIAARVACAAAIACGVVIVPAPLGAQEDNDARPVVGVAFGGGGARGFAHVGVIRWFEEHHVPIDLIAGTSMGGLVGGGYATGMSSAELAGLLRGTDWSEMFGASAYRYKSMRRKEDARAYPARLEFHIRHGVSLPMALNNGQQVDLLLAGIAARYAGLSSFDSLPTPFRCVAFDLRTATSVILDHGSLPRAMRATMSLPGVFPPVLLDNQVLVDGGAIDNVPADVVRAMGATVVIAIDVGSAPDTSEVTFSVIGLMNNTVDAMTRANARRGMATADIVIRPNLEQFDTFDWRRARELFAVGYRAAESARAELLPLALDDKHWQRYLANRRAKRRVNPPVVTALDVVGATPADERIIRHVLRQQIGHAVNARRLAIELTPLDGLDRYEAISWDLAYVHGTYHLVVEARPRPNAPPIMMSTLNVQNRTSDEFTFQLAARFLSYDTPIARAELRVDGTLGTDPALAAELRRAIVGPVFVAFLAGVSSDRVNLAVDDAIAAQYGESRAAVEADAGLTPIRDAELRFGFHAEHYSGRVKIGAPGIPSLSGPEYELRYRGVYDGQNSAVLPSDGLRLATTARHVLEAPEPPVPLSAGRTNDGLSQADVAMSRFWSWHHANERVFTVLEGGTSFGGNPLITDQFVLGLPFRLEGFAVGERRGNDYAVATGGYLHSIGQLPDFLGGPIVAGAWIETGSAFDHASNASVATQLGIGVLSETLLGPGILGFTIGSGARRFYVGFGRLFR